MTGPMQGVKVLEVAQFTFVPAAGAVLADWGADVIKVEHAETGDAQRGLVKVLGLDAFSKGANFFPIMEGPNRGKRSVGLALEKPEALEILHELIKQSDVFLTNFLPSARAKLGIDEASVRAVNPEIIYAVGSGFGLEGEEADKPGYDQTAYWARGGSGHMVTAPDAEQLANMPTGAYGDSIGGMALAGGIAGALYKRATTGETSVVDVSLIGVGAWATQFAVNLSLLMGGPLPRPPRPRYGSASNPLIGSYQTSDGRWVMLTMLQPGRFWPGFVEAAGRPELAGDERFDTVEKLMANAADAAEHVAEILAARTYAEAISLLESQQGPWSTVQDTWEVGNDASLRANGLIAKVKDVDGVDRELVANPVKFDGADVSMVRAPQFAEHTDDIVRGLGRTDEQLIELKIARAIT